MQKEENVYTETDKTEEATAASEGGGNRKNAENASAVLGKFKDVDALARAYGALQAEFTRRSQRLKELERKAEKFENGTEGAARSGAEKLRKNAEARRAENKRFDEFVAQATQVGGKEARENVSEADPAPIGIQPSKEASAGEEISGNGDTVYETKAPAEQTATMGEGARANPINGRSLEAENAEGAGEDPSFTEEAEGASKGEKAFPSVAKSGDAADSSELLYAQVCRDESVRLRIIGEYLSSIGRSGAPLMTGGVGVLATPPQKAKSISDAGDMALRFFKKPAAEY